jgi:Bacterial TSP3 repeat
MSKVLVVAILALASLAGPVVATGASRDRNRDGLPDRWEQRYGLSTKRAVAGRDPDRDGLSNYREYRHRTNPRRRDTDRDGLGDGTELRRYRTDPRKRDTDGDSLDDRVEIRRYHTNPRKRDTDGDGFGDGLEVRAGTDPGDPSRHPIATTPPSSPPAAPPAVGSPPAPPAPPRSAGFPTPASVGVPAGWAPAQTRSGDLVVTQAGAVVQDVLLQNADLIVDAPNVTIRRVKLQGGVIFNTQGSCQNGMVVEDSTLEPPPGQSYIADSEGVVGNGGYTARRVKIWRRAEGFRDGGKSSGCGPVRIEDSFEKIVIPPGRCDLHSDGIQGYDGPALTVVNTTIDFNEAGCGTAPFFVPDGQGNTSATVDRLLVMGGGATFRLGVPATVTGLKIVDRSWFYAPLDVKCSLVTAWDASIVTITPDYQVATTVRPQSCNTETGS